MKHNITLIIVAIIFLSACSNSNTTDIRDNFKKYYDQHKVEGSFVLFDQNAGKYFVYNQSQLQKPFIPASTFKICNSLIGLETGVITDENYIIPWDGVKRSSAWDKDHTLKTAFQNSTVWYYRELARRVGGQQMKLWLDSTHYGNADTSGGIDKFWLSGKLRITPDQQIDFLKKLNNNELPFSQRSVAIVKKIMIVNKTDDYILRAKTGWGIQDSINIGWYVGYIETSNNVYYFSNCVQANVKKTQDTEMSDLFEKSRKEIAITILKDLKIIEE